MSIIEDGGTIYNKTSAQRQAKADTQGEGVFDTDLNQLMYNDGSNWHSTYPIADPSLTSQPTLENIQLNLRNIHRETVNTSWSLTGYYHGQTVDNNGYLGGVYSPNQKRIYMCPFEQSENASWHYIDCVTGEVVSYDDPSTAMANDAFWGGAYSPELDRIYFSPYGQSDVANWAYVNCKTGVATAYSHGYGTSIVNAAYIGAVHSPTQGRIYFIPATITNESTWHYVDCSDGTIDTYVHGYGTSLTTYAFRGGCYDPYNDIIWLIPHAEADETNWHRIDCSDGSVDSYAHGTGISTDNAYAGGVYDPINNYVWFIPKIISNLASWHYVDCSDLTVHSYAHGFGTSISSNAFFGGCYDPILHVIWLSPYGIGDESTWYYIDCRTKVAGSYNRALSASDLGYMGAVFDPINNRTYFMPYNECDSTRWHYIQSYGKESVSPQLMSHAMFNKGF